MASRRKPCIFWLEEAHAVSFHPTLRRTRQRQGDAGQDHRHHSRLSPQLHGGHLSFAGFAEPDGPQVLGVCRTGELVPDEFTISLWKQYIKGMEMVNQFHPETEFLVLDGIPRNLGQAGCWKTRGCDPDLYLRADLSKMVERLRRRALKENRIDDASDVVIKRRLEVYERETRPVLDFYPPEKIHRVDATLSQIRVLSEIVRLLVPMKEQLDTSHAPLP